LFEFSGSALGAIPSDSEILGATFSGSVTATTTATSARVYNVKTAWSTAATWNKPLGEGAEWPGGTPYDTSGSSATATVIGSQVVTAPVTSLVREWIGKKYGGFYGLGFSEAAGGSQQSDLQIPRASATLTVTYAPITGTRRQYQYDTQQLDDETSLSVNVGTGDLHLTSEDFGLPGPGIGIAENHIYDSRRLATPVDLSAGWKLSLGRETHCTGASPCEGAGPAIWDGPDGSVVGLGQPELSAKGVTGTSVGEGTELTQTVAQSGLMTGTHPDMIDNTTGMQWEPESKGTAALWGNLTTTGTRSVRLEETPGTCPTAGPTLKLIDWVGRTMLTLKTNCVGAGKVTEAEDNTHRVWKYGYDASNRLQTYTDPEKRVTTYGYDANSLLNKITTPAGNITLIAYDPTSAGRVLSITREDSHETVLAVTKYAYSQSGQSGPCQPNELNTTETDPAGRVWQFCFDSIHRPTHEIDPLGHDREATTYGVFSNVHTRRAATGSEGNPYSYTLEPKTGQTTVSATPTGAETSATYSAGLPYLPVTTHDAQGNELRLKYNAELHLESEESFKQEVAAPEQLHLTWSEELLRKAQLGRSPNQQTTEYKYDVRGNQTEIIPPAPDTAETATYDELNRPATRTDGNGNTTTYHYDNVGRLKEASSSDGTSIAYEYDADGNLVTEISPAGIAKYTYDGMGRRTSESFGGQTITTEYFPDSEVKALTDASGTVNYTYNGDGEVATISDPATRKLTDPATEKPAVVELKWDTDNPGGFPHGNLLEMVAPTGASGKKTGALTTSYTYDGNDRIKTVTSTNSTATLQKWSYSYINAANGNRQTARRQFIEGPEGQRTTYTYDYLNRLVEAVTKDASEQQLYKYGYCYNTCAGHEASAEGYSNVLKKTTQTGNGLAKAMDYFYNADNQLTTDTAGSFAYDKAGNMTSGPGLAFGVNARQQVSKITLGTAEPLALGEQGAGNALLSTIGTTRIENGANGEAATSNLEGGAGTYYTRTPEGLLVDSRDQEGNNAHYYVQDDKGSVVRTTNQAGAPDQNAITYGPYGTPQGSPTPTIPTFGFDGGYQAVKSGSTSSDLIHLGSRYYEPTLQSWTQSDPQQNFESLVEANGYSYAGGDPINLTDPSGEAGAAGSRPTVINSGIKNCADHPTRFYHEQKFYYECKSWAKELKEEHNDPLGVLACKVGGVVSAIFSIPAIKVAPPAKWVLAALAIASTACGWS